MDVSIKELFMESEIFLKVYIICFPVDFTWEELQTLRTRQRYSFRDDSYDGEYSFGFTNGLHVHMLYKAKRL